MTALESSLKRRMAALEGECDTLASAVERLSVQLKEAYQLLQKYEPDYVAEKMGLSAPTLVSASIHPTDSNAVPEDTVSMPQR